VTSVIETGYFQVAQTDFVRHRIRFGISGLASAKNDTIRLDRGL
jgi:hypothetical protein